VAALDLAFYEAADALWKRVGRGDMEPGRAEAVLGEILEFLGRSRSAPTARSRVRPSGRRRTAA